LGARTGAPGNLGGKTGVWREGKTWDCVPGPKGNPIAQFPPSIGWEERKRGHKGNSPVGFPGDQGNGAKAGWPHLSALGPGKGAKICWAPIGSRGIKGGTTGREGFLPALWAWKRNQGAYTGFAPQKRGGEKLLLRGTPLKKGGPGGL